MATVYGPQPTKEQQKVYDKARKKRKILRVLKETTGTFSGKKPKEDERGKVDRGQQFANYLATIDRLSFQNFRLRGRVGEGPLTAKAGSAGGVKVTKMSTILDNYHDKALRMAQAKYYQKQLG